MRDKTKGQIARDIGSNPYGINTWRYPIQAFVSVAAFVLLAAVFRGGWHATELFTWSYIGFVALAIAVAWLCLFVCDVIIDVFTGFKIRDK